MGLIAAIVSLRAFADDADYEEDPINYSKAPTTDVVAKLQRQVASGKVTLKFDPERGYLDSVLEALHIPACSQMLVFSKTSFQGKIITPKHPRALYFNDDAYIGFVHSGDVLEFAAADPQLGAVFYTLDQKAVTRPQIIRQTGNCLECHASSMTRDEPGFIVRSVYPDASGQAILSDGTYVTNDSSPIKERWGGWYVTAKSGASGYMGNITYDDGEDVNQPPDPRGANVLDLAKLPTRPDLGIYLKPTSDVVALCVHAHQTDIHNRIARANYGVREAMKYQAVLNKALGDPGSHRSDSTISRIKSSCEPLVEGLLFSEEVEFPGKVEGTSGFAEYFSKLGPRDGKGRSLRDFDLQRRLFKYPCSYLIYSAAFDALPREAKDYIYQRMFDILSGKDQSKEFANLTPIDRGNVLEILRATKRDLPKYWVR